MPSAQRVVTAGDVRAYVEERCFATSSGHVGAEVEWLTVSRENPQAHPVFSTVSETVAALEPLPGGSRVTYEPGGQLELSSAPTDTAGQACLRLERDVEAVRAALGRRGIDLAGVGLDPRSGDRRVLDQPRYAAMEAFFDAGGPEGRRMMRRTAAIQVNLDSGAGEQAGRRWRLVHELGPVLAAMFANSPVLDGTASGWRSTRLATWWAMDRTRTAPARQEDPFDSWTSYLLGARVMFLRTRDDVFTPVTEPVTFRHWMEHGLGGAFPDLDDLAYHATTVFPPVRPRGWLELRMIDAQAEPWWRVPVAVCAALLDDETASDVAERACTTAGMWIAASRYGLEHPALAAAASACMTAALDALPRIGADPATAKAASAFAERFTFRRRSPADDFLEDWSRHGSFPPGSTREPAWT